MDKIVKSLREAVELINQGTTADAHALAKQAMTLWRNLVRANVTSLVLGGEDSSNTYKVLDEFSRTGQVKNYGFSHNTPMDTAYYLKEGIGLFEKESKNLHNLKKALRELLGRELGDVI